MIPLRTNIPHGFCQCGCGEKTRISPITSRAIGWVKGEPIRFIRGHANRQPRTDFSDAQPFKIDGVYCKLLSLTRGLFTIIDASDYEWLSSLHWYALKAENGYYVVRHAFTKKKVTGKHIYLHRLVLGLADDDECEGDHENGVTLDHRRKNLRPCLLEQNKWNHKRHRNNTSGITGVSYCKERDDFVVLMRINGKPTNLGRRKTFKEACALREAAEKKYRGQFVRKE